MHKGTNAFTFSVGDAVTRRIAVNAPDRGTSRVSGGHRRSAKFPTFQMGRSGMLSESEELKDIT